MKTIKLYYHMTDGGAEYLCSNYIKCGNGHKEGVFEGSEYIVRIDGNLEKGTELRIAPEKTKKGTL